MSSQIENAFKSGVLFLALVFICGTQAQIGAPCHANIFNFTPRHSLNISRYMGLWYLHEIAGSHIGNFPPPDYRCYTTTLSLPDENDLFHVHGVDRFVNTTDGTNTIFNSDSVVNDTRSPLSSMWSMTGEDNATSQVIILFADLQFSEWTIVYSCSHTGPFLYRYEVLMAMTRSPVITPQLRQNLKSLMVGNGFRIGDHQTVDQNNCPLVVT